jgi:hypothetical protein
MAKAAPKTPVPLDPEVLEVSERRPRTNLTIPRPLLLAAKHAAIDRDITVSDLVCELLEQYLARRAGGSR